MHSLRKGNLISWSLGKRSMKNTQRKGKK